MTNPDLASIGLLVVVCWLSLMGLVVGVVAAAVAWRFWSRLLRMDDSFDGLRRELDNIYLKLREIGNK